MTDKDLKIVFFGTPEFAVESLEALLAEGCRVEAVVTMPDKKGGRGNRVIESAVKKCARAHGLPLLQPEKLSDPEFLERLRSYEADLFIVIAFRMLPRAVWQMPPMGTFNLHGSLLPRYRGAAPINRAIMNGETTTGVTTFMLRHELDTGDILQQEAIEIGEDENLGSVYDRLMKIGARLTVETVRHIAAGDLRPMPQDELTKDIEPVPAPKIFHEDCHIDWNQPAEHIHNQVRGLSPVPGAWTELTLAGEQGAPESTVKILATTRRDCDGTLRPGELESRGKAVVVGTGTSVLKLITVQPAGKKAMDAADWFRGLRKGENGREPWLR